MFKKTASALFALILLAGIVHAGNAYQKKEVRAVEVNAEADQSAAVNYSKPAKEVQIIEKRVEVNAPKPAACDGFAIGTHYGYPVLAYKTGDYDFEIGYKDYLGDRMGLLRSGYVIWSRPETWTYIKNGIAYFPGAAPEFGLYLECEAYLTPCVAVSGAIYPLRISTGSQTIVNDATFGARVYW